MEPGCPLAGTSSGTVPLKCVFGDFLRNQKVTRRRPRGPHVIARAPPLPYFGLLAWSSATTASIQPRTLATSSWLMAVGS